MKLSIQHQQTLTGHKGSVFHIEVLESTIYSCSADGVIAKWNLNKESGEAVANVGVGIYTFHISKDYLLIGSTNGVLTIINFLTNDQKHIQLANQPIYAIALHSETSTAICGDGSGTIYNINLTTFNVHTYTISNQSIRSIAVNKTQNLIAIGCSDASIYCYTFPEFNLLHKFTHPTSSIFSIKFLTDVEILAGGRDAKLRKFNLIEKNETAIIDAHLSTINTITSINEDGLLLTASRDKSFKIWDAESLTLLKVVNQLKYPDKISHSINTINYLGNQIITGSDDGRIQIWNYNKL